MFIDLASPKDAGCCRMALVIFKYMRTSDIYDEGIFLTFKLAQQFTKEHISNKACIAHRCLEPFFKDTHVNSYVTCWLLWLGPAPGPQGVCWALI